MQLSDESMSVISFCLFILSILMIVGMGAVVNLQSEGISPEKKNTVKLLLIPSTIRQGDILALAANKDVTVLKYDTDTTSLEELYKKVQTALDGHQASSIAFASHDFGEASFYLTAGETVNLGTTLKSRKHRIFWEGIGNLIENDGRIDIFACNLAQGENGKLLIAAIKEVAGRAVAASNNNTGNPTAGGDWILETAGIDIQSDYFEPEKLKQYTGLLLSELKKLNDKYQKSGDYFGFAVSVKGSLAIVGAFGKDIKYHPGPIDIDGGEAYLFERDKESNNWKFKRGGRLTRPNTEPGDHFGIAVDIDDPYAVVAAPNSGKAYIYAKDPLGDYYYDSSIPTSATSISIYGSHIAAGEPNNEQSAGVVKIFKKGAETGSQPKSWDLVKRLTPYLVQPGDHFGCSVSLYGDYLLVGSYGDDDNGSESGSAYLFYRNHKGDDNWGQQFKFTPEDGAAYDHFGAAVSMGLSKYVVIGAPLDDDFANSSGSAYIFYKDQEGTGRWGQQAKLHADDASTSDHFGSSVSSSGIYAVIGAYGDDDNGANSGSGYIFHRDYGGTNSWGQMAKFKPTDGAEGDQFTRSVHGLAMDGNTIIAGASQDDDIGIDSGSAYIFTLLPIINDPKAITVDKTEATLGATVTSEGLTLVVERGFVWDTEANPTTSSNEGIVTDNGSTGAFNLKATSLTTDTAYYYRGYAKNDNGTAYTNNEVFYTGDAFLPTIENPAVSSVGTDSADFSATVTGSGDLPIFRRGFVWGTSPDPGFDINGRYIILVPGELGDISGTATGLIPGTVYYFRGFAQNAAGVAFTENRTFRTLSIQGKLKVKIKPTLARKSGPMWRVSPLVVIPGQLARRSKEVTSPWYQNGKTIKLTEGQYLVEFYHTPGWVHEMIAVDIVARKKLKVNANFTPYLVTGDSDYDGDGRSDISVYRPASTSWLVKDNYTRNFGTIGSWPVPGDYDGDGTTDLAWWNPESKFWKVSDGLSLSDVGQEGDIPVPGDYNGDGLTDPALYRPVTGEWLIYNGSSAVNGTVKPADFDVTVFGGGLNVLPVPGDYDGNGTTDIATYNMALGEWHFKEDDKRISFGSASEMPVHADYNGDGMIDIAVVDLQLGQWRIYEQFDQTINIKIGYIPVPGDYDGDGQAEIVYFRPSNSTWYFPNGTEVVFGESRDIPLVRGK